MFSADQGDVVMFDGAEAIVVATDEDGGVKVRLGNGLVLTGRLSDLKPAPVKSP